jgi:integrase
MARKPLPLGSHGNIRLMGRTDEGWKPKAQIPKGARLAQWRAIANYRGYDGRTRPVQRDGTSGADATNRLREHVAELNSTKSRFVAAAGSGATFEDLPAVTSADRYLKSLLIPVAQIVLDRPLSAASRVLDAVPAYLERIQDECSATTVDRYVTILKTHVVPDIGRLLFIECTVARLQEFDANLVSHQRIKPKPGQRKLAPTKLAPKSRRVVREVVRGLLQIAVEASILDHNPVRSMRRIKGGAVHPSKALPAASLPTFFAKVDTDKDAQAAELPDIFRTLLGLTCRIGEAMALTWRYINLTDKPVTHVAFKGTADEQTRTIPPRYAWINATISEPEGRPAQRTPAKTDRSNRIVPIPDFLYLLLITRKPADAREDDPVFLNPGQGKWRSPRRVRAAIYSLRRRIDMPDLKSHGAGRKTGLTVLYDSGLRDTDLSDQAGHSSGDFTRTNYVEPAPAKAIGATMLDRAFRGDE